jgi:hypothetical protein
VLVRLAEDKVDWVRYYVNLNPNTPPEIRARLAGEPLPREYQDFLED